MSGADITQVHKDNYAFTLYINDTGSVIAWKIALNGINSGKSLKQQN